LKLSDVPDMTLLPYDDDNIFSFLRRRGIWWLPIKVASLGSQVVTQRWIRVYIRRCDTKCWNCPHYHYPRTGVLFWDWLGGSFWAFGWLLEEMDSRYDTPPDFCYGLHAYTFRPVGLALSLSLFEGRLGVCSVESATTLSQDLILPFSSFYILSFLEDCRIWTRH